MYVALDNHKFGDMNPYLVRSTDRGQTWISIAASLPNRTLVWHIVQDHVNASLLFADTEFGVYFTVDGGGEWVKLGGDAPTISFREIAIPRRENNLIAASFGRGFFIMDDNSPLRGVSGEFFAKDAHLFALRDAYLHVRRDVAGGSQGPNHYAAPNPDFGATFTYYLKNGSSTLRQQRKRREKALGSAAIPSPRVGPAGEWA